VLEAATELFEAQGIDATKVDDICEAADVAKRTLSNHFPTKAHIVRALSDEAVSRSAALIDSARTAGDSTRDRLDRLFRLMREALTERGPIHRESLGAFFVAAHGTPQAAEGEIRISDAVRALLEEGRPEELPPSCTAETFAGIVLGTIYSTSLEWIHRDGYDVDTQLANASEFLLGLMPER